MPSTKNPEKNPDLPVSTITSHIGFKEFIGLIAAMMATQAIAVDAMLPALSAIAHSLDIVNANDRQWIITAYMIGLGVGQLFWGLLSDRFGRKPVLIIGLGLYTVAGLLCSLSSSFYSLLAWRLIHGVAAASLVVARSIIRDCYEGRDMARIMSLTFIVFLMVPVIAPAFGQLLMLLGSWHSIFFAMSAMGAITWLWTWRRLPETLHPEFRLKLEHPRIAQAIWLVMSNRASLWYTLALTLLFGALLAYVATIQQVFADVFHHAELMPTVFALGAGCMGVASVFNSRFVQRLGMRVISHAALLAFIVVATVHTLVAATGHESLVSFAVLQSITMVFFALTASNFGAMAMEPLGSVAGIGAAMQGFVSTLGAAFVGAVIGRFYNGSSVALTVGTLVCGLLALVCAYFAESGRLFKPHHADEQANHDSSGGH